MYSARFVNDGDGRPIAGGPQEVLVAFTMSLGRKSREPGPLQMRVRDDATAKWLTVDLPTAKVADSNVRELFLHRDSVTGADLLFVGANPAPLGLIAGRFDATAPGRIRWSATPEFTSPGRRGMSKWFGMATVNGVLFASDAFNIFRRVDGPQPKWVKVLEFPRAGDEGGAEVRGLTAVPNPKSLTGWPEEQMLVLATQFHLWRMRVPTEATAPHPHASEIDLRARLTDELGQSVVFAEGAFNRLIEFHPTPDAPAQWPVGVQVVYEVPGKKLSNHDPESFLLKNDAWFFLRDANANYTLQRIADPARPDARLFLARDFKSSPFASEPGVLYACGFNGSYWKGSLGTAWIYKGTPPSK
jgi:hypothetical protein